MSSERWQVSGSAAEKYELFVASWFAPWATDLVEKVGIQPGARVLDVACGTGIVTRAAASAAGPTGSVTATDLNDGMLAEGQRHPAVGAPIVWQQADATELPFAGASFDAVVCQQGLQFVPDRAAAASEMRRVLRPGGVAGVSVWQAPEHNPYLSGLAEGLRRHVSPEAAAVMLAPCALGDRQALAELFFDAGFSTVEVYADTISRSPVDPIEAVAGNLAALPIAERIASMAAADRDRLIDDIVAGLEPYIEPGGLTAPSSAYTAIAVA